MTFHLTTRWCRHCANQTPHETETGTGRERCVPCAEKKRGPTLPPYERGTLQQHLSALDGAGNRGEHAPRRRGK